MQIKKLKQIDVENLKIIDSLNGDRVSLIHTTSANCGAMPFEEYKRHSAEKQKTEIKEYEQ